MFGDSLFVGASAMLVTTDGLPPIYSAAGNIFMTVAGFIGGSAAGIALGDSSTDDTDEEVYITQSGVVSGSDGIRIIAAEFQIQNQGTITADSNGIYSVADQASEVGTIHNTGAITGAQGIWAWGTTDLRIINSGTIMGFEGGAIALGNGDDKISNTGLIDGNVFLGGGTNIYDGSRGGTVVGTIQGDRDGNGTAAAPVLVADLQDSAVFGAATSICFEPRPGVRAR